MGWVRLARLRFKRHKTSPHRFRMARPNQAEGASDFCWILGGAFTWGMRTMLPKTLDLEPDNRAIFRRQEIFLVPARLGSTMVTGVRWICRTIGRSSCRS